MAPSREDPAAFNAFEAEGWKHRAEGYHEFFDRDHDASDRTASGRGPGGARAPGPRRRHRSRICGRGRRRQGRRRGRARRRGGDGRPRPPSRAEARFVQGDAEQLPFEDASFDAAVANFAILHVGRPERMARELARVLSPGGRVALTVWDLPERSRLMGVFVDAVARAGASPPRSVPAGPDFFRFSDDGEMRRLLAGAGLEDVDVQAIAFEHRLAGASQLWEGMLGGTVRIRALVEGQSPEVRRRIREEFDRLVAEHVRAGRIEIPVRVKLGSARRA